MSEKIDPKEFLQKLYVQAWDSMRVRIGALIMNQVWKETLSYVAHDIARKFVKKGTIEEAVEIMKMFDEFLGIESEIVESTDKKIVMKVTRCPFFENVKNTLFEWEIQCQAIFCGAIGLGIAKAVSPNLKFKVTEWMHIGPTKKSGRRPHCIRVIEWTDRALTLDGMRCKHEIITDRTRGECEIYKWCPYGLGFYAPSDYPREDLEDCPYYEPRGETQEEK
ncbi:MAG: hypothetical protein ACTSXJ_07175 [Candidatus Baldrarchaeia archaeon]